MNKTKQFFTAVIIALVSLPGIAAEHIKSADPSLEQIAVISVLGAATPDELIQRLSKKADAAGASKFKIVMTSSNDNSERGTAIAYK